MDHDAHHIYICKASPCFKHPFLLLLVFFSWFANKKRGIYIMPTGCHDQYGAHNSVKNKWVTKYSFFPFSFQTHLSSFLGLASQPTWIPLLFFSAVPLLCVVPAPLLPASGIKEKGRQTLSLLVLEDGLSRTQEELHLNISALHIDYSITC